MGRNPSASGANSRSQLAAGHKSSGKASAGAQLDGAADDADKDNGDGEDSELLDAPPIDESRASGNGGGAWSKLSPDEGEGATDGG